LKRQRVVLGLVVTLALALSLAMAVPVYAVDVGLAKGVTPATPNEYELGETIHYTMMIKNMSLTDNITVEALWDVLPGGSTVYPIGPLLPYTLTPGQNQTYTYDWVATETGTVVNTFHASGHQIPLTGGEDAFNLLVEKSSLVHGREVGGTALPVNKLGLLAPWAVLLGCAGVVTLLVLRKRRQA
jgi:uncharacterized repeat protein (TIGR01451 family)